VFAIVLAFTGRVLLSGAIVVIVLTTLVLINNAKFRALREPVLFSDFGVAKQILEYPKVYFPFFGTALAVALLLVVVVLLCTFWMLDTSVYRVALAWVYPLLLLVLIAGLLFCSDLTGYLVSALGMDDLSLSADKDVPRFGLIATIFVHFLLARQQRPTVQARVDAALSEAASRTAGLANSSLSLPELVVVVQAESFFDIRKLHSSVQNEVLANYDEALANSFLHGKLEVPAWGANTVRTEFSVLTGLPAADLGLDAGNPYQRLVREQTWSYLRHYQELGYRTICVHPYYRGFYGRGEAFARLGFDDFLDIKEFNRTRGQTTYVGDIEFAEKLVGLLQRRSGRTLLFGITMESHGPFGAAKHRDVGDLLKPGSPLLDTDVPAYLEHLMSCDVMIQIIRDGLQNCGVDHRFCLYGDHVPSLPSTYEISPLNDPRTDYFLLSSDRHERTSRLDLSAHELFGRIITA